MIGYLRGKIIIKTADFAILDANGVGYRVFLPTSTINKLVLNEEAALYIHTSVREDAIILYGFYSEEEYDAFLILISVSGIGPKGALGVLSSITVQGLFKAIREKQINVLTKLPGIGKKSAERMILELKDKVAFYDTDEEGEDISAVVAENDAADEAKAALLALGYGASEIAPALKKAKGKTVEETIKEALKILNRL
ncbi:MAG: Holliday junction branch migration protein RuvA [Selenomonadaceae bacterium]|nr:Holliday junction branch migration protein RuvA [Selenomonadaceae bacterium]